MRLSSDGAYAKKKFNKIALIDADRYKHVVPYWVWQELGNGKEHSKELVDTIIEDKLREDIFDQFECRAYIFCFSAPSKQVFRNWIAQEKEYKGNRKNRADYYDYPEKFEDMGYVFKYIKQRYSTLIFDDLEADDIVAMLQQPEDTFIFSHDKDLKQVVGFHYDMEKRVLMYTDESTGLCMLLDQMLKGDTIDNIPGLVGFGDKALMKHQEECEGMDDVSRLFVTLRHYINKHGVLDGMDIFSEMWHLLSMRTARGKHLKEKYAKAFVLMDSLTQKEEA